jgi:hypothetical protein
MNVSGFGATPPSYAPPILAPMALHHPMMRATAGMRETAAAATPAHADLRSRLVGIALLSLALDVVAAVAAFAFERGEAHEFSTVWTALFWTTTQLLTVSSQLPNPESTGAHLLDVFLELWAITAVTALAGSFGAFFHHRSMDRRTTATDTPAAVQAGEAP